MNTGTRTTVVAAALCGLLAGCSPAETPQQATADPAATRVGDERPATTVSPEEAVAMTIADVLRTDGRFSRFKDIVERIETPIADSILDVWDWDASRMGDDRDGVTVFVPTNEAFDALDPAVAAVLEDPDVANTLLYELFGHHYVHRLYPREDFETGPQRTWRQSTSGPVQLELEPLTWAGHGVEQTDLRTTNGYIHVISGVVLPDSVLEAAGR